MRGYLVRLNHVFYEPGFAFVRSWHGYLVCRGRVNALLMRACVLRLFENDKNNRVFLRWQWMYAFGNNFMFLR